MADQRLFELVPDYINEHLSAQQTAEMEAALQQDTELRRQVRFERMLQQSMRTSAEQADAPTPHFAAVRAHINGPTRSTPAWLGWGMPIAAGLLFVVLGIVQLVPGGQPVQTFETLSDTQEQNVGNLRIILAPDSSERALQALVNEYQLNVVERYPDLGALDVTLSQNQLNADLAAQLAIDDRVLQVRTSTPRE